MILLYIISTLFLVYGALVIYYWMGWRSIPVFAYTNKNDRPSISVIIPARNEEKNIERLLETMQNQSYPSDFFEVIVVDDHSTDATAAVVKKFDRIKLISLSEENINSFKKKAIEKGILTAKHEWIVTTDADCVPGPDWLSIIASRISRNDTVFIAAPVSIECNSSILQVFQAIDFMVLQSITGAVVHNEKMSMCNGANITYSKKAFTEAGGFSGIDDIASGDDMMLMYKIWKKNPGRIKYLKSPGATVHTAPMRTWKSFFNQRIRWASKAKKYSDRRIFPVLLLVYLFNFSFPVLLIGGFFIPFYWIFFLALWLAKTFVELPLFISAAQFFNKGWAIKYFFFFQPLHIFYTILSGFLGQVGKYEWKGRVVR